MLRTAWLLTLLTAIAAIVLGVICQVAQVGPPIAVWVAVFLLTFGLNKLLVALQKLAALRLVPAGGPDPRADFASPFLFWAYIATKCAVFVVGWVVAFYLLAHPVALSAPR